MEITIERQVLESGGILSVATLPPAILKRLGSLKAKRVVSSPDPATAHDREWALLLGIREALGNKLVFGDDSPSWVNGSKSVFYCAFTDS